MKRFTLLFPVLLYFITSSAQYGTRQKIYVVDSVHYLSQVEVFSRLAKDDVADSSVVAKTNAVKLPPGKKADTLVYLFTRAYRARPDSLKKIPSLLQMAVKNGGWCLGDQIYNGNFIDYYVDGNIQRKGSILDGAIHGENIVYYPNGQCKSVFYYDWNVRHGPWTEYYKNGALATEGEYSSGKIISARNYFLNGQLKQEIRLKKKTAHDTLLVYFSTGKINIQRVSKNGIFYMDNKELDLREDYELFYQELREGNLKKANKYFYRIWKSDSSGLATHFQEGLLMMSEYRFDEAITQFTRVLEIEPLLQLALEYRALARLKKYKYPENWNHPKDGKDFLGYEDLFLLPQDERSKVCSDLHLCDLMDLSVSYTTTVIPPGIIDYCRHQSR